MDGSIDLAVQHMFFDDAENQKSKPNIKKSFPQKGHNCWTWICLPGLPGRMDRKYRRKGDQREHFSYHSLKGIVHISQTKMETRAAKKQQIFAPKSVSKHLKDRAGNSV